MNAFFRRDYKYSFDNNGTKVEMLYLNFDKKTKQYRFSDINNIRLIHYFNQNQRYLIRSTMIESKWIGYDTTNNIIKSSYYRCFYKK